MIEDWFIVFGSRTWRCRRTIRERLLQVPRQWGLIHGGADGADTIAGEIWTELVGKDHVKAFLPLGKARRYYLERNCRMASQPNVRLAIGFRMRGKSSGTDHMRLVACPLYHVPVELIWQPSE